MKNPQVIVSKTCRNARCGFDGALGRDEEAGVERPDQERQTEVLRVEGRPERSDHQQGEPRLPGVPPLPEPNDHRGPPPPLVQELDERVRREDRAQEQGHGEERDEEVEPDAPGRDRTRSRMANTVTAASSLTTAPFRRKTPNRVFIRSNSRSITPSTGRAVIDNVRETNRSVRTGRAG